MSDSIIAALPFENIQSQAGIDIGRKYHEEGCKAKGGHTDLEVLRGLQRRDQDLIKYIYREYFRKIKAMILFHSGTSMDAEDIFQDALIVLYKQACNVNFSLNCALGTYLYAICRNLWLQRLHQKALMPENDELINDDKLPDDYSPETIHEEAEKLRLLGKHFELLSGPDQKVLRLFLKKVPLARIAEIMGFKSTDYAKTRKYLIKEKLKNSILSDPQYLAVFEPDNR